MPEKSLFLKWSLLFVILGGLALSFYTHYRAAILSLTHDEAVIYQLILSYSSGDIINYVIPQDHMINTLLMKFSSRLLPHTEYTLRLPNLIGHLLYIIFSILLLLRIKNPHLLLAGFILLNFNPYLLDFFSVARGYGLSVSFMMVSLYYGFTFIQSRKIISLFSSFIFAMLAVLSVYTLLNYFIALCGIVLLMIVIWWIEEKFTLNKKFLSVSGIYIFVVAACIAILYLILVEPLQRVQAEQFIYQSKQANFYTGTIRPIIFRSIYNSDPLTAVNVISYSFLTVYALAFVMMVIMSIRRNFSFTKRLIFFSFIISLVIVLSVSMQNELFNIRFVRNRMATFIAPLMVLTLIGLFEEFINRKTLRIPALILLYIFSALFLFNTIKHANVKWYLEWQYDASTREMLDDLCEDAASLPGQEIKLGIAWFHEPSVNFYSVNRKLDWLKKVDRNGYNGDFDYFYVDNADSVLSKEIFRDKEIIKSYEKSNTVLLKKVLPDE
jgi:hypothetical protein